MPYRPRTLKHEYAEILGPRTRNLALSLALDHFFVSSCLDNWAEQLYAAPVRFYCLEPLGPYLIKGCMQ